MNKFVCVLLACILLLGTLCSCAENGANNATDSSADGEGIDIYGYIEDLSNPEEYIIIGQYKGIEVTEITVTESDVEKYKADIQNKYSYYKERTDKTVVEVGDNVSISYVSYLNGKKFDGGEGSGELVVGDGTFIFPEVEQHLSGVSVGNGVSVPVVVPDDYFSIGLRGKTLLLKITVESILESTKTTPELDLEFVKEKFGVDSLEAFDEYVLAELNQQAENDMMEAAWKSALGNCEIIQFPEGLVEAYIEAMYDHYEKQAAEYGADVEIFIGDEEEWLVEAAAFTENYYKAELAMFSILDREFGREISDGEYRTRLEGYANDLGITPEQLEEAEGKDKIITSIYWDKVMEVVWDNRVVK